jgi:transposase InsO family protein
LVGADGVRTDPKKVAAIVDMPFPASVPDVRSFLGMVGYYSNFIRNYAAVAAALYAATHVKYSWSVTEAMIVSFAALKEALLSDPVLRQPDFTKPFVLTTDWSQVAMSGVLGQLDADFAEHAVQFASRMCSAAERNYCATHGECAAIIWAIHKFRPYLFGNRFHLKTDHRALQWLKAAQFTSPKLARWSLELQEYDFTVAHCRGDQNVVADYLSRAGAVPGGASPAFASAPSRLDAESAVDAVSVVSAQASLSPVPDVDVDSVRPAASVVEEPAFASHALSTFGSPLSVGSPEATSPVVAATSAFTDTVFPSRAQYDRAFACAACGRSSGDDNMAICDVCSTLYHLRCLTPPMTSIPSGPWYCPTCAPHTDKWEPFYLADTPLRYHERDPHRDAALVEFVFSGDLASVEHVMETELSPSQRRSLTKRAATLRPSAVHASWLDMCVLLGGRRVWRVCPTLPYRWDLIRVAHDALGHAGITRTVTALCRTYYWTGVNRDVRAFVSVCDACQRFQVRCPDLPKNMQTMTPPDVLGAFRLVHLDTLGPFPHPTIRNAAGKPVDTFILIIICAFTKCLEYGVYVDLETGKAEKTAELTCKLFFEHWISRYIVPDVVVVDNGTEFGAVFENMCADYGITVNRTAVRNPQANGVAESAVRYTKHMLRRLCNGDDLAILGQLPKCRGSYMRHLHRSTGLAPFTLTFGLQPDMPAPFGRTLAALYAGGEPPLDSVARVPNSVYHQYVENLAVDLADYDLAAFQDIVASQYRNVVAFERALQRAPVEPIMPNDFVLLLAPASATLQASWSGPFLYTGLDSVSGLAVLQSGSDRILDATGRGHLRWKVAPHLLRKYRFPFQLPSVHASDANLVAPLLQRG